MPDPEEAVISASEDNALWHPGSETPAKPYEVKAYRTDEDGTINFTGDLERIRWRWRGKTMQHKE